MRNVAFVGYGNTKFSKTDANVEDKLLESTKEVFENNQKISQKDIQVVLVSTNDNKKYLSAILSEKIGIEPNIAHSVESLCNSGTNAIVSAYSYISSGLADVALVSGVDRYDSPGQILEWDKSRGEFKHPIFWASIFTKAYKRKFSVKDEDMAIVSVKNHKNAKDNPNAYSEKQYTINDVLNSRMLTEDLHLLDCSRPCTGSSSVILTSEEKARKFSENPIWIRGIGQKTVSAGFTKNPSFTSMTSTKLAAKNALDMANISPNSIDVTEVHDAFSVCEPMAIEDLGIASKGEGIEYVKNMYETDNRKINPRGGIIGSGHPLGATGIAQTIEIIQQLNGTAEKRQIPNATTGLVHNMSAAATSSTVLVLQS